MSGLSKPVKLKEDMSVLLGSKELSRTEITKKLWNYIKANKLQTRVVNGIPENAGKNIVADFKLVKLFKMHKPFAEIKEGQTIDMMKLASVVSANIE